MSERKLKPCPFCGCDMRIYKGKFPNGDDRIEPYGFHNSDCPLHTALWHTYPEDGWTEDNIAERWNRRVTE